MKIAAIDVGTNSFHLIVARVGVEGGVEVVDRAKEMVRIGDSAFRGGVIAPEAFARGAATLKSFQSLAERHGCDAVVAVATSAVREAHNGGEFVRAMKDQTGLDLRVISGEEEARLIYLGARSSLDFGGRRALLCDIGGGSVELIVGDAREIYFGGSLKLGVLRLLAERVTTDPIAPDERARLVAHCHRAMEAVAAQARAVGFDFVALSSGTASAIAALVEQARAPRRSEPRDNRDPTPVPPSDGPTKPSAGPRNRKLAFAEVLALEEQLCTRSAAERARLPGMDPRRVDSIVPGVILVRTLLEVFHADELTLSDAALREGLVADYVARNRPGIQLEVEFPDLRRRSVVALCRRCGYHRAHAEHVARLALDVFRGTRALHGLSNADGELLEFAALLHDIGYHIAPTRHHKHGAYLVANAEMKGFGDDEITLLAQVVRYHRKSTPKESHPDFAQLAPPLKKKVRQLAAILRLADALDFSYQQRVAHVRCEVGDRSVTLRVDAGGDIALEVYGARSKRDLFEETFGLKVRIEPIEADGA